MHNFTPEDLLEYHYGEMPNQQSILLEEALKEDWALREKLSVIEEAASRLDKSMYAPRQAAIDRILQYATSRVEIQVAD